MGKVDFHFLLFCLICSTNLLAQHSTAWNQSEKLDSMARLIQETYDIPGLVIGVIKNDEVFYANTLGVQGLDTDQRLTEKSLFHMASVSKPVVATAIMLLVDAGKLNLEDKLVDCLPYFEMKGNAYKRITLKHILNHTSGIPDVEDYEWDNPQLDEAAAERYVRSFKEVKLDFKPGKGFNYSNAAFDILADVIAKASGMSFEAYVKANIFEPAGMKNTTFLKSEVPESIATGPHSLGKDLLMERLEVYPYNRIHAPSSTMHSNLEDMLRWAIVNLNQGEIEGQSVYTKSSYRQLTTPTRVVNEDLKICLSWFVREVEGEKIYYHTGGDEGYATFFGFFPEQKASVILMANNDLFQSSSTALYLVKTLLFGLNEPWKQYIYFGLKARILTEGIAACKDWYYQTKEEDEASYYWQSGQIDQLGYDLIDRDYTEAALEIFLFNVELNPDDAGFYDSVGDAYMAMDNKEKAIEWYTKALDLNPKQGFTKDKLKKLR